LDESSLLDSVSPERLQACLQRHVAGDWGELDQEDKDANDAALTDGSRLLSAYLIDEANPTKGKVWIITEADRSVTTFLLPSEY
jgi:hypothetical protein